VSGWERIVGTATPATADAAEPKTATADCTPGKKVFGGGYEITGGSLSVAERAQINFYENAPSDQDTWRVSAGEEGNLGGSTTWQIRAYALCATAP
jgi:hypothetical protein